MNKFEQLVHDLETGALKPTHIRQAYNQYIKQRKDIPVAVKDLLCGGKVLGGGQSGIIDDIFRLLFETVGFMELSYRRGNGTEYDLS